MGMFFSNIHCRQTDSVNAQAVRDAMAKMMEVAGYQLTEPQRTVTLCISVGLTADGSPCTRIPLRSPVPRIQRK